MIVGFYPYHYETEIKVIEIEVSDSIIQALSDRFDTHKMLSDNIKSITFDLLDSFKNEFVIKGYNFTLNKIECVAYEDVLNFKVEFKEINNTFSGVTSKT